MEALNYFGVNVHAEFLFQTTFIWLARLIDITFESNAYQRNHLAIWTAGMSLKVSKASGKLLEKTIKS